MKEVYYLRGTHGHIASKPIIILRDGDNWVARDEEGDIEYDDLAQCIIECVNAFIQQGWDWMHVRTAEDEHELMRKVQKKK